MSIFKQTFKPFLCRQINARQDLMSIAGTRPSEFHQYTTAKSPWVRMQSFVNHNGSDALARKYVLEAGTLIPSPDDNTQYSMRYGIGAANAAYGSNLGNRDYGLMPMPGITSVNIRSKSAYGSLREATIKFMCWDKKQLEELEILFMRPGYEVLLEWGWSMYIDSSVSGESYDARPDQGSVIQKVNINDRFGRGLIKSFDSPTINAFQSGITQDDIYDRIKRYQHKFSGNYDATLGKIVNFSWNLLPNGGYECTTILISIGDVLDSLKINSSTGLEIISQKNKDYKTEFELLLTGLKTNEVFSASGDLILSGKLKGLDTNIHHLPFVKQAQNANDDAGSNIYYIQFAYLIHILNERYNLFDSDKNKYINIECPVYSKENKGNGLCLASVDSISIDPEVCIIKNPNATFLVKDGFDLYNDFKDNRAIFPDNFRVSNYGLADTNPLNSFLYDDTTLGVIGNIYVSIDKVISIYNDMALDNNGSVILARLISAITNQMSFALGSINDFDIYVSDNTAVIIDKHYTEFGADSSYKSKFQLNLIGNNSVIKNMSVVSKIFASQTTMIAIAAQNRDNIAGIQSSTNSYLNNNISSRLIKDKVEYSNQNNVDELTQKKNILINNIQNLVSYVNEYVMKRVLVDGNVKASLNSALNSLILKINTDANNRAVVPISLEVGLDGIGGITIGEIFTINPDALPKEYNNKNIGFIVTGISQDIVRSEWKTSLTTQVCLLDQDDLYKNNLGIDKTSFKSEIASIISNEFSALNRSIDYYNILASFIMDYCQNVYQISQFNGIADLHYDENRLTQAAYRGTPKQLLATSIQSSKLINLQLGDFGKSLAPYYSKKTGNASGLSDFNSLNIGNFDTEFRIQALDFAIHYSDSYINMVDEIKNKFDTQYADMISEIKAGNGIVSPYHFPLIAPNSVLTGGTLKKSIFDANNLRFSIYLTTL